MADLRLAPKPARQSLSARGENRVSQQLLRTFDKHNGVGQSRMMVKRSLIRPLRTNREQPRLMKRFKYTNCGTTVLSSRWLDNR